MAGPAEPGGQGGQWPPPEFPRFDKVGLSQSFRADQGCIALAPSDFCTFRRPWMAFSVFIKIYEEALPSHERMKTSKNYEEYTY